MNPNAPIGFFDSGVGGLSVLNAARRALPNEDFIYFGDCKNAPYGTKSEEEIIALAKGCTETLLSREVKAIVIACNTVTGIAYRQLKSALPVPLAGTIPAVRRAQRLRHGQEVLLMATPAAIQSRSIQALLAANGEGVLPLPCPGLVELIEGGHMDSPELRAYLSERFFPYRHREIGVVVLGCTHYPFIQNTIAGFFPRGTLLINGSRETLRSLTEQMDQLGLKTTRTAPGKTMLLTSGNADNLRLMERLLDE